MNEAEKANQEADVFLREVRLQNYKSIIDAEIDFKAGLNIIIGKNGSGKTNFLTYLYDVVDINWDEKQGLLAEFTLVEENTLFKIEVEKKNNFESSKGLDMISLKQDKSNVKLYINNQIRKEEEVSSLDFNYFIANQLNYYTKIIHHGIPNDLNIVEKPLQLVFSSNGIFPERNDVNQTYFIKSVFNHLYYSIHSLPEFNIPDAKVIVNSINTFLNILKEALESVTDIKNLRISPNFNLYFSEDNKKITIHNLYLEFLINETWMPYKNLSDGSKRLFYIISEITAYSQIEIIKSINNVGAFEEMTVPSFLILLEEPELGIHPHQLHKLMLFIKEQSKTKQIILTTHSPQVLNILEADELDRIIICNYDKEKGTQLNHLTEKQIKKGQMYMQDEGFLSDYWVHSDLEPGD